MGEVIKGVIERMIVPMSVIRGLRGHDATFRYRFRA